MMSLTARMGVLRPRPVLLAAMMAMGLLMAGSAPAFADESGYYGDARPSWHEQEHEHERREWREHEWREHERREWREHEFREHARYDYPVYAPRYPAPPVAYFPAPGFSVILPLR